MLEPFKQVKVGIIPCNGEEICEGTLTRFACRKVLDTLRPNDTVTICLPLFIAGDKGEQNFAKTFPTITVDGCEKRCSAKSTEKLSGKPRHSIVISDLLRKQAIPPPRFRRTLDEKDEAAIDLVAQEIAARVDEILKKG
jgi:uncharacterized metal-binding protein